MIKLYDFLSCPFGQKVRIVLARNDAYWGGKEPWQNVTLVVISSAPSRVAALLSGQVDAIEKVVGEDVKVLQTNPKFSVVAAPSNSVTYVVIDQYRHPRKRVEPHELGLAIFVLAQIDLDQVVSQGFLGQDDSHLLAEGAGQEVIEFDHIGQVLIRLAPRR